MGKERRDMRRERKGKERVLEREEGRKRLNYASVVLDMLVAVSNATSRSAVERLNLFIFYYKRLTPYNDA